MCPDAPAGYDHYYYGRAYKSYLDSPMNYHDAQTTCFQEGTMLPVFTSKEDYIGARVMAGDRGQHFWFK